MSSSEYDSDAQCNSVKDVVRIIHFIALVKMVMKHCKTRKESKDDFRAGLVRQALTSMSCKLLDKSDLLKPLNEERKRWKRVVYEFIDFPSYSHDLYTVLQKNGERILQMCEAGVDNLAEILTLSDEELDKYRSEGKSAMVAFLDKKMRKGRGEKHCSNRNSIFTPKKQRSVEHDSE